MPRPPRIQVPHGLYHVTARGNRRQVIFEDAEDHHRFLVLLDSIVRRRRWLCHGYCLMPNHYHLIIETPDSNLSVGMQHLNGAYAQAFNDRHALDGHVFQGRFHAVLIESTWHFLELVRYLARNPVAGGLCTKPGDWGWGSYAALVGEAKPRPFMSTERVLGCFGRNVVTARRALQEFVNAAA